jgi:hypothetical protein
LTHGSNWKEPFRAHRGWHTLLLATKGLSVPVQQGVVGTASVMRCFGVILLDVLPLVPLQWTTF